MAKDALSAHARDEFGFTEEMAVNPVQAAGASAVSFSVGAALPMVAAVLAPHGATVAVVSAAALIFLAMLGALGAWLGGAPPLKARFGLLFGARSRWR
jgi:VIT1/CCC1 family predicted Fe2+/Mn2+ transporter